MRKVFAIIAGITCITTGVIYVVAGFISIFASSTGEIFGYDGIVNTFAFAFFCSCSIFGGLSLVMPRRAARSRGQSQSELPDKEIVSKSYKNGALVCFVGGALGLLGVGSVALLGVLVLTFSGVVGLALGFLPVAE